MSNESGYYIEYRKKSGEIQKASVLNKEQVTAFRNRKFVRLLNDDLTHKTDENGKKLVSLIELSQQTRIFGYFD